MLRFLPRIKWKDETSLSLKKSNRNFCSLCDKRNMTILTWFGPQKRLKAQLFLYNILHTRTNSVILSLNNYGQGAQALN